MTWTGTRIQELKMLKHIQGRTNSIKCENMVALICLLRPLARTAQKAVPHGGWYCHVTLKLGRNSGNPGFKATSWQEVRQAKKLSVSPHRRSCYSHQQRQGDSWHAKPSDSWQDTATSQRTSQLWTGNHWSCRLPLPRIWKQFLSHPD